MVDEEELLRQSSFPIPPKEQKDNFWWVGDADDAR